MNVPWMAVGRLPRKAAWKAVAERTRGGLVRTSCSRSFPRCPRMLPLCMALVETLARAGAHDCVHMLPIPSGVPPQGPRGDPRPCWPFSLWGRGVWGMQMAFGVSECRSWAVHSLRVRTPTAVALGLGGWNPSPWDSGGSRSPSLLHPPNASENQANRCSDTVGKDCWAR